MPHPILLVWAANGMPHFPDAKRGANNLQPHSPNLQETGSKTSSYRTSTVFAIHSRWNSKHLSFTLELQRCNDPRTSQPTNCSSSAMDFSDVALGLAALLVAVISALVAVLVASTFAAPPPPKRSQLLGRRKIHKG